MDLRIGIVAFWCLGHGVGHGFEDEGRLWAWRYDVEGLMKE